MPTVEIRFSPLPSHVRTARLMAVAVARRSHVDEAVLDEVRLAVGEACSRAVRLHQRYAADVPVVLSLSDDHGSFTVDVVDEGPYDAAPSEDVSELARSLEDPAEPQDVVDLTDGMPSGVVLAVIAGLVDTVTISPGPGRGTKVHMQWPSGRPVAASQSADEHGLEYDLPV